MTTTYNISYNAQYDSHEVTFETKPATAVLDALKALKMRWNPKKACWYGFAKEHEIISAILENGEGETIAGEKTEGATVYTDGYTGGGAVYGSKSNHHLHGAELSKAIREDIKRAGIKCVSVRCKTYSGGQSVTVTVSLRQDEFVSLDEHIENFEPGTYGDYGYMYTESGVHRITNREFYEASAEEQKNLRRAAAEYEYEQLTAKECSLNIFYLDNCTHLTPEALAKIKAIQNIICAYRYDESNAMVDYFSTNFYYDIYTKPAAVKPTTPDNEPTKPTKEEPAVEQAPESAETAETAETASEPTAEQPTEDHEAVYTVDDNGHDIAIKRIGEDLYSVEFREDGKRLGAVENYTSEAIDFWYGVDVNAAPVAPGKPEETELIPPENPADIAYTANLRSVYENTISRIETGEYYGHETAYGLKMALEYLQSAPEILTEKQLKHAMRLAMCRRETPVQAEPSPESEPAETLVESDGNIPEDVPQDTEHTPELIKPSPIREDLARRAHEMMSYGDYREGSATAEYNALCERAKEIAETQKKKVDPMYHDKIDALLASYMRRMADNINKRNEIGTRCPSVLVAGPANFPVRKKLKQNAASDRNMEEYNEIQGILHKIRSVGTGGISGDDPNAREKIEKKINALEALQSTMKAVNAYYRKHNTLEGCPDITPEQAEALAVDMAHDWRSDPKPFEAWRLSNNTAEIRRLKARLSDMDKLSTNTETGWSFDGGTVEICRDDNRVRIFHDEKPGADVISELKRHGFKWARSVGAWQRQLTENAIEAARRITT